MNKGLLVGVAALALLGAIVLLTRDKKENNRPTPKPNAGTRDPLRRRIDTFEKTIQRESIPATPKTLRYRYNVGDLLDYRFDLTTSMILRMSGAFLQRTTPQAQTQMTFHLAGTIRKKVYESNPLLTVGWNFQEVTLSSETEGGTVDAAQQAEFAKSLNQEILVEMTPRGEIKALYLPKSLPPEARGFLKNVILMARFIFPEDEKNPWVEEEEDMTGKAVVQYSAEHGCKSPEGLFTRIMRQRLRYFHLFAHSSGGEDMSAQSHKFTVEGETTGYFKPDEGEFHIIRTGERTQFKGAEFGQDIDAAISGHMELQEVLRDETLISQGKKKADELRAAMERSEPCGLEGAAQISATQEKKQWKELVGDLTWDQAFALFEQCEKAGPGGRESYDAWNRLVAFINLSDEAAHQAKLRVLSGQDSLEFRTALIDALGAAGTEAAQRALIDILKEVTQPELKESSILGLSMTSNPLPEAEAIVKEHAGGPTDDPVTSTALLGVGIMGSKVAADQARADNISKFLREAANRSQDPHWKNLYLEAMGNSGHNSVMDEAKATFNQEDAAVRGTAAYALRFVKDGSADTMLSERATTDPSPEVRVKAVQALAMRDSGTAREALSRALQDTSSEDVRRAALTYFASRVSWDNDARRRVEVVATSDPSAEMRRSAQEVLTQP